MLNMSLIAAAGSAPSLSKSWEAANNMDAGANQILDAALKPSPPTPGM